MFCYLCCNGISHSFTIYLIGGVAQSMIFSKAFQSSKIIQLKTTSNAVVGVLAKRHQQHK
ncbi:hypothetical protein Fleli_2532 [Bernardetia litoralis DSM 6794]|uniref:Uncharacterized protein n=1 Tax=Bernardetia litoralis (strain ATCC 23117 / DSM 6794 / NBRC 15988 / NCIMB 1366 / Fx l1 / Sio-4) TaxID=880071 RepID=I4ALR2_BERLS|nr:hypothetical protein [Bernardetia litoralis]AFM04897.1 hypothetical protein Fleli_2532 [Bernardetia litoralis DSM 6794]